jgi:hypothetical protein
MKTIYLVNKSGLSIPAKIECEIADYYHEYVLSHRVRLSCEHFEIKGEGDDSFEAFCRVREELESRGWLPLCYGASRNVYPSGMCRDMGGGTVAYKLIMGQLARLEDLVEIFDTGPDVEPATVNEQYKYWRTWLASLVRSK